MATRLENDETAFPAPRRAAVAQVLGVPESWFTEPLDALVAQPAEETSELGLSQRLDGLEAKMDHLVETVDALLRDALERLLGEAPPPPSKEKSNGQESAATGN